jgi:hypothetical protein
VQSLHSLKNVEEIGITALARLMTWVVVSAKRGPILGIGYFKTLPRKGLPDASVYCGHP